MPLLPSTLPPKGEARRYVANDFLNLIALLIGGSFFIPTSSGVSGLWYNEGMQRLMTSDLNATFWHRHYLYSAALLYFYAPHHNPEPANLNP